MTPADRSTRYSFLRLAALFRKLTGHSPVRPQVSAPPTPDPVPPATVPDLSVSQFVHDLRNHLTVVIGCANDVARLMPRGEGQARLAELIRAADRAATLTRELLIATHPEVAVREVIDANSVAASEVSTFAALAGERISMRLVLCTEPLLVAAERSDLERILLNLALNARDAMPGGGVLTIETSAVLPSDLARREGARPFAKLTVTDTGVGMTPETKTRIFDPLFTTKATGTGLGLTTVAFTVRQLQGMISVESDLGRGTSVSVILPLADHSRPS
jgi:two-component system, cell cycle sensor histidine kinase and response regulator CckA